MLIDCSFALLSPSKAKQDGEWPPTVAESLLNARTDNMGKQETAVVRSQASPRPHSADIAYQWTYSPRSGDQTLSQRITAKWTNLDGTTVDAAIVATGYGLVLTGDAYACAKTFGGTEVVRPRAPGPLAKLMFAVAVPQLNVLGVCHS